VEEEGDDDQSVAFARRLIEIPAETFDNTTPYDNIITNPNETNSSASTWQVSSQANAKANMKYTPRGNIFQTFFFFFFLIKIFFFTFFVKFLGSLFVDGMTIGVGTDGIIFPQNSAAMRYEKLPMRERLIILSKLGAGASSAVYKALDLTDMKLVALKTIHILEK
jgi:hypothetical protein